MRNTTSTKIAPRNRRKLPVYRKVWFWAVMVLLVAAVVFGVWWLFLRKDAGNDQNKADSSSGAVPAETSAKAKSDAKSAAEDDPNKAEADSHTPTQYDGDDPNKAEELSGYISYAAVNEDLNGGHLSLRMTLNQYLSSGTCQLTMTSGGNTVTKEAEIFADVSTSSCQGFDVPLAELPSGHWLITIKLSSEGKTGTITGEYDL